MYLEPMMGGSPMFNPAKGQKKYWITNCKDNKPLELLRIKRLGFV